MRQKDRLSQRDSRPKCFTQGSLLSHILCTDNLQSCKPLKTIRLPGVTNQMTTTFMLTALRNSNLYFIKENYRIIAQKK